MILTNTLSGIPELELGLTNGNIIRNILVKPNVKVINLATGLLEWDTFENCWYNTKSKLISRYWVYPIGI